MRLQSKETDVCFSPLLSSLCVSLRGWARIRLRGTAQQLWLKHTQSHTSLSFIDLKSCQRGLEVWSNQHPSDTERTWRANGITAAIHGIDCWSIVSVSAHKYLYWCYIMCHFGESSTSLSLSLSHTDWNGLLTAKDWGQKEQWDTAELFECSQELQVLLLILFPTQISSLWCINELQNKKRLKDIRCGALMRPDMQMVFFFSFWWTLLPSSLSHRIFIVIISVQITLSPSKDVKHLIFWFGHFFFSASFLYCCENLLFCQDRKEISQSTQSAEGKITPFMYWYSILYNCMMDIYALRHSSRIQDAK